MRSCGQYNSPGYWEKLLVQLTTIIGVTNITHVLEVRHQQLKYFGHVTRHNGLEKTITQLMVAGKRSRRKPRQRWDKDIADTFGMMAAASRVAEDRHHFRRDILKRICFEKNIDVWQSPR